MSKREWIVLAGIVGLVLVGLALEPDHAAMPEHTPAHPTAEAEPAAGHTVTLAVSGMT